MHPNQALIRRFYTAFQARDGEAMGACYHPDAVFSDPAFGELHGAEIGAMWTMLTRRATDLVVTFDSVSADDARGAADWEARYTFTQTGRPVINRVHAGFAFRDGLIVRHDDHFAFWRWARQALGPAGLLLGWTPLIRGKVRSTARASLAAFQQKGGAKDPAR